MLASNLSDISSKHQAMYNINNDKEITDSSVISKPRLVSA